MEIIRLITVHPAIVHFTLGTLPVIVLAYAVAYVRRSERWTFVADIALVITAVITVATAIFGLVSFTTLHWPGGIGVWRWLHLAFGALVALTLLVFAALRLSERRRGGVSGGPALVTSIAVSIVAAFVGWVGGEVLVYHSGAAVLAAGDGALAPPIGAADEMPGDLASAMGRLRGDWAAITTGLARSVVVHPTVERYGEIGRHAQRIEQLAEAIVSGKVAIGSHLEHGQAGQGEGAGGEQAPSGSEGGAQQQGQGQGGGQGEAAQQPVVGSGQPAEGQPAAQGALPPSPEDEKKQRVLRAVQVLQQRAAAVSSAAEARRLPDLATAVGQLTGTCADCHLDFRWTSDTRS